MNGWVSVEYMDRNFYGILFKFWQSLPHKYSLCRIFLPLALLKWKIYPQVLFIGISVQSVVNLLAGDCTLLDFPNWVMQVDFQVSGANHEYIALQFLIFIISFALP